MLTVEQIREVYRRIARRYDRAVALFPVFGVRMGRYRRDAVVALGLAPGQTVVELGCGTGLNFPLLLDAVGPHGHVIGVDLSDAMLVQARGSIQHRGWRNVELVCADIADYGLPPGVDAVLSTFAITLVPAFDEAIRRAAAALRPGGRLAILDLRRPPWPDALVRFAAWLNRPFGVTVDLGERHPWESMRRHLANVQYREYYFGAIYLCVGERSSPSPR
jgi:demethylmenaquinone methyltransferase/2-methoxy-6-polyprenyl-1,4-benzoquinol methylase